MKFVPKSLSVKVGRTILQTQKHSPRIMFVAGVAGVVTSAVLACRATLKLSEKLEQADTRLQLANETGERSAVTKAYVVNVAEVVKLYAPAVIIGGASVGLLTQSHVVLCRRNAALTAAYSSLQTAYDGYRERVREEIGEERERDIYLGTSDQEVTVDGKKQRIKVLSGQGFSPYAQLFDEYNRNWQSGPGYNRMFLQAQQNYFNDILKSRGHLFLNEVYENLGFEHTKEGQAVGWIVGGNGDNYVDFGFHKVYNTDFMTGVEPNVILDFNVDGVMWNLI